MPRRHELDYSALLKEKSKLEIAKMFIEKGALGDNIAYWSFRTSRETSKSPNDTRRLRNQLRGHWSGVYTYTAWPASFALRQEPTRLDLDFSIHEHSDFHGKGRDQHGAFDIYGQVFLGEDVETCNSVRFAKLYATNSWLYHGSFDEERKILSGTWGRNQKLWNGSFFLQKKA